MKKEDRRPFDVNRSAININPQTVHPVQLGIVISSSVVSAGNYQWQYTVKLAELDGTTFTVSALPNSPTYTAYSISEMTNNATTVAWGVVRAHLPAGVNPVKIPNNDAVAMMAQKKADGTFYYLILNSQAITGPCP
jgi:hypothetical protein